MGMYTALHFGAALKLDTPTEVIDILRYMTAADKDPDNPPPTPAAELFSDDTGWHWMLLSDSYYFQHETNSQVVDFPTRGHALSITCNLKNYNDEISKFLDWITPYVDAYPGEWLGYWMFEEDEKPTLIFMPDAD